MIRQYCLYAFPLRKCVGLKRAVQVYRGFENVSFKEPSLAKFAELELWVFGGSRVSALGASGFRV